MSYKDRYGITKIKDTKSNNLSVSWDSDSGENNKDKYPVFLYTPWMEDTNDHYHIPLCKEEAQVLKDWLEEYLKDVE